jgi:hypothetical protein
MALQRKVYLSKSRLAKYDTVSLAKMMLVDFGIKIAEHMGGAYTASPIYACNTMIVIPPADSNPEELTVGKGVYTEVSIALDHEMDVFVINEIEIEDGQYNMLVSEVKEIEVSEMHGRNWNDNWGRLYTTGEGINIENYEGFRKIQRKTPKLPTRYSPVTFEEIKEPPVKSRFHLAAYKFVKSKNK